jgi:uncharacterized iron-regulated protein
MRRSLAALLGTFLLAPLLFSVSEEPPAKAHILRLADHSTIGFDRLIGDLRQVRLVFMGEIHDDAGDHRAQLRVIRGLDQAGVKVAIGLEMFRSDSQSALDRWVAGKMGVASFLKIFNDNWSLWPVYGPIFLYARHRHIPMIGLNIPREISEQVAMGGFTSLSPKQLARLPVVSCNVDEHYKRFIRRALDLHDLNQKAFTHFCEAQMLWDGVMARGLLVYLAKHPATTVVVLAGAGHAWRYGIPTRVHRQSNVSMRVLLPEIPGRLEARTATLQEADYLLLGLDQGPLR